MANICWFEIRVRGKKADCLAFAASEFFCHSIRITDERGSNNDYMVYMDGTCRWSVTRCLVNVQQYECLAEKARRFNVEVEACGFNDNEDCEHYHYKGSEMLDSYCLASYYFNNTEFSKLTIEDKLKYSSLKGPSQYKLNEEFYILRYDADLDRTVFKFKISFDDIGVTAFNEYD